MDFNGIKEYLREDLDKVNSIMASALSSEISLLDSTNRMLMSRSGKQIRPVLGLLTAKACSGGFTSKDTLNYAAASELLHNATLLHDDVADNSPMRRGEPTVMSLLGGRASVLLGDFWLVKAMDSILAGGNSANKVMRIFASTLSDLAEGELLQLQKADSGDTQETDYYKIIYNKTASLFVASAVSAALSVGASEEKVKAVKEFAKCLGLAFQIRDDIFDYQENASTGKPAGMDLKERKITLPLLGALAQVDADQASKVRRMVCGIDEHPEYQSQILSFVKSNGGVEYACRRLREYVDKAKIALRQLGSSEDVSMLADIAEFTAEREV